VSEGCDQLRRGAEFRRRGAGAQAQDYFHEQQAGQKEPMSRAKGCSTRSSSRKAQRDCESKRPYPPIAAARTKLAIGESVVVNYDVVVNDEKEAARLCSTMR
jgi:hypothetical protein